MILKTNGAMNKVLVFFSILIVAKLSAVAQRPVQQNPEPEVVTQNNTKHGIGVVMSATNGKGLAYRYWPKTYGIQVSFVPISVDSYKYYNVGVTGYARIKKYNFGELFLHTGVEYQYQSTVRTDYLLSSLTYQDYTVNSTGINAGLGPGYHFEMKPASFDIFFGYGAYVRNESSSYINANVGDRVYTFLTGGVAVFLNL